MGREIKFRAWDKIRNIMCYDIFYLNSSFETENYINSSGIETITIGDDLDVMQFTGLSDKNGKEIYEGDIILYEDTESEYVDVGLNVPMKVAEMGANNFFPVEFRNGSFGIQAKDGELLGDDWYTMEQFDNETSNKEIGDGMEIIGSIYENKDLLK